MLTDQVESELNEIAVRYCITFHVFLKVDQYKNDVIYLNRLVVPEHLRGKGLATMAMNALIRIADKYKLICGLGVNSSLGGDYKKLVKFYERFGFYLLEINRSNAMKRNYKPIKSIPHAPVI